MDFLLREKTAVITGPAKGMGRAISMAFAQEGVNLALLGRDIKAIEAVVVDAEHLGVKAKAIQCDVTDGHMVERAISEVMSWTKKIDILVNVAGGTGPIGKTGLETSETEFDDIIKLNLGGVFSVIKAVAPIMKNAGGGKIVNIGGTFGMRGRAMRLSYSSSKWGLRGLTKSFALELGGHNINVNLVAPGMVDGPRFREKVVPQVASQFNISKEAAVDKHCEDYALGRISEDKDIANAVIFLISDDANYINGETIHINGGLYLG